jgi:hypothetical protein
MVQPRWTTEDYWRPSAGEIPGEAVFAFTPTGGRPLEFQNLEPGHYHAFLFNPSDGAQLALGSVTPDAGAWRSPEFPIFRDWVVVLDRKGMRP